MLGIHEKTNKNIDSGRFTFRVPMVFHGNLRAEFTLPLPCCFSSWRTKAQGLELLALVNGEQSSACIEISRLNSLLPLTLLS